MLPSTTVTPGRGTTDAPADGGDVPAGALGELVQRLAVEDKVRLLTGATSWSTVALPAIGLAPMVLSDGPSGVRGERWDERDPSLLLPSATSLSASWDVDLAHRYGAVAAGEARRKGVHMILGPTINLHRSPLGGRSFEAFSEDPLLTADLAAAYVRGVQAGGVAACPKHYVANDSETERYTVDVRVAARALREVYLAAFEPALTDAGAWAVMSAYNGVNGSTMTESPLLTDPLTAAWGFDGVVVSDWTAVRTVESARHPQDLAMPGPGGPWGAALVAAVRSGEVEEAAVDRKVERILRLAARVGALEGITRAGAGGPTPGSAPVLPGSHADEDGPNFARRAAAEGMVLLHNDRVLPLQPARLTRVALLGHGARDPRVQGGGSATVIPAHVVTPLEGLRAALAPGVVLDHRAGAVVQGSFTPLDPERMADPVGGGRGAHVSYHADDGTEVRAETRLAGFLIDFGDGAEVRRWTSVRFATRYTPEADGELRLGIAGAGTGRLWVDGALVLDEAVEDDTHQVAGFFAPPTAAAAVQATAGRALDLRFEFEPGVTVNGSEDSWTVTFGTEPGPRDDDALIAEAVAAAAAADVAVVVVGTSTAEESEGFDRTSLRLPGRQDDLVAAVAAANRRTVVVVAAGAPVEMPWRDDVAAVLLAWFGGQELGHALADVLLGVAEPGGRLPTTWPARLEDAPVSEVVPTDGVLAYDEGLHVGYRAWQRTRTPPAYPFGAGEGYTSWELGEASATGPAADGSVEVALLATNTGHRAGKQLVQVYARRPVSAVERPVLWLVGFAVVRAAAGEAVPVRVRVPQRAFAHWDGIWVVEPGTFEVLVGTSCEALAEAVEVVVPSASSGGVG